MAAQSPAGGAGGGSTFFGLGVTPILAGLDTAGVPSITFDYTAAPATAKKCKKKRKKGKKGSAAAKKCKKKKRKKK